MAATVGTVLLVVIAVALAGVVGLFMFDIVKLPEEAPDVEVVYTHVGDRWGVHISEVTDEYALDEFRLMARHPDGTFVSYDPDGDGTADVLLISDLSALVAGSGSGPAGSPIAFLDVDGDGMVSAGDQLVARGFFVPEHSALMDGSRGFKVVGQNPHGIPLDSTLYVVATPITLATSGLSPGDEVWLEVKHGGTVEAARTGHASAAGTFVTEVYLEPTWHKGNHKALFTIRPGELDEWVEEHKFKTLDPEAITPEEEAEFEQLKHPMQSGDVVSLIHKPSNQVILEFVL